MPMVKEKLDLYSIRHLEIPLVKKDSESQHRVTMFLLLDACACKATDI